MEKKYRPGIDLAYKPSGKPAAERREVLCDQFREPREYGFSPLRCIVWSGILAGGLTVGGILVRWVLGVLS